MSKGIIFASGLIVVLLCVGFVFFAKRGDHLAPKGLVIKERTHEFDENRTLLVMDVRLVNGADVAMNVRSIAVSIQTPDGGIVEGGVLGAADLKGSFQYYPLLGEQYTPALTTHDQIPARATVDKTIAASFEAPRADFDGRKKVTVRIADSGGTVLEFSGK
jgi:hypothetical protein